MTCENPFRDSDRVYSRPDIPASAVSIGESDLLFDVYGRQGSRRHVDLHLVVGDVRHRIDREALQRVGAIRRRRDGQQNYQPALMDREGESVALVRELEMLRVIRGWRRCGFQTQATLLVGCR